MLMVAKILMDNNAWGCLHASCGRILLEDIFSRDTTRWAGVDLLTKHHTEHVSTPPWAVKLIYHAQWNAHKVHSIWIWSLWRLRHDFLSRHDRVALFVGLKHDYKITKIRTARTHGIQFNLWIELKNVAKQSYLVEPKLTKRQEDILIILRISPTQQSEQINYILYIYHQNATTIVVFRPSHIKRNMLTTICFKI